jgi:hypothetical protein
MPHKDPAVAKEYFRQRYMEGREKFKARSRTRQVEKSADIKVYNRTPGRVVAAAYGNALRRVTGKDKKKAHLYAGLSICSRESFIAWALADAEFKQLHVAWELWGFPRRLTPTIDRIDEVKGYEHGNMRWLPQFKNSALTTRWRKL